MSNKKNPRTFTIDDSLLPTASGSLDELLVPSNPLTTYKEDSLYQLVDRGASPSEVYDQVLLDTATEIALLKQSRDQLVKAGGNFTATSDKIIKALEALAKLNALKAKDVSAFQGGEIDFDSDGFKSVMQYLLIQIKNSLKDASIPTNLQHTFIGSLQNALVGFEDIAKKLYSGHSIEDLLKKDQDRKPKTEI